MGEFEILDTDEPLKKRMERHAFDRLIMLSDGVFAIAITLAALEIKPPEHWDGEFGSLLHTIGRPLVAYLISFVVIGIYWMTHRRMVSRLRRVDAVASVLNLLLLGMIALQPAAVRLLIEGGVIGHAAQVYYIQIGVVAVIQATFWGYASFIGRLVDDSVPMTGRLFSLIASLVLPMLGAWFGITAGTTSTPVLFAFAGLMIALAIGRRLTERRMGL